MIPHWHDVVLLSRIVTLHSCDVSSHFSIVSLHGYDVIPHWHDVVLLSHIVTLHSSDVTSLFSIVSLHGYDVILHSHIVTLHSSDVSSLFSIVSLHGYDVILHWPPLVQAQWIKELGTIITSEKEEADFDFSLEILEKDSFTKVFK